MIGKLNHHHCHKKEGTERGRGWMLLNSAGGGDGGRGIIQWLVNLEEWLQRLFGFCLSFFFNLSFCNSSNKSLLIIYSVAVPLLAALPTLSIPILLFFLKRMSKEYNLGHKNNNVTQTWVLIQTLTDYVFGKIT